MNEIKIRSRRTTNDNNHAFQALYFHAIGTGDTPLDALYDLLSRLSKEEQAQFGYVLEPDESDATRSIRG